MNDAGVMRMKILQSLKDLFGPFLEDLNGDVAVLLAVIPEVPGGADLSDEIDIVALLVLPHAVTDDDVLVAEGSEQIHLRVKAIDENRVFAEVPQPNLIPRHLDSFLLIKRSVNFLHSTATKKIAVTPEPPCWINLNERFHFVIETVGLLCRHFQSLSLYLLCNTTHIEQSYKINLMVKGEGRKEKVVNSIISANN